MLPYFPTDQPHTQVFPLGEGRLARERISLGGQPVFQAQMAGMIEQSKQITLGCPLQGQMSRIGGGYQEMSSVSFCP